MPAHIRSVLLLSAGVRRVRNDAVELFQEFPLHRGLQEVGEGACVILSFVNILVMQRSHCQIFLKTLLRLIEKIFELKTFINVI